MVALSPLGTGSPWRDGILMVVPLSPSSGIHSAFPRVDGATIKRLVLVSLSSGCLVHPIDDLGTQELRQKKRTGGIEQPV